MSMLVLLRARGPVPPTVHTRGLGKTTDIIIEHQHDNSERCCCCRKHGWQASLGKAALRYKEHARKMSEFGPIWTRPTLRWGPSTSFTLQAFSVHPAATIHPLRNNAGRYEEVRWCCSPQRAQLREGCVPSRWDFPITGIYVHPARCSLGCSLDLAPLSRTRRGHPKCAPEGVLIFGSLRASDTCEAAYVAAAVAGATERVQIAAASAIAAALLVSSAPAYAGVVMVQPERKKVSIYGTYVKLELLAEQLPVAVAPWPPPRARAAERCVAKCHRRSTPSSPLLVQPPPQALDLAHS